MLVLTTRKAIYNHAPKIISHIKHSKKLQQIYHHKRLKPLFSWQFCIAAAITIYCLLFVSLFVVPRKLTFSYAQPTCRSELTIAPKLHRTKGTPKFEPSYKRTISIANIQLASLQTCFTAKSAPDKGTAKVTSRPLNLALFTARYTIATNDLPRVLASQQAVTQALSKQLELPLTEPDSIFTYQLKLANKTQACTVNNTQILCPVKELGLAQGSSYTLMLERQFSGKSIGEPSKVHVTILSATNVTDSSIKTGQTVYTKPKNITVNFDKPLKQAAAKLELIDGDKATAITTQLKIEGSKVDVSWADDLPREKTFRLTFEQAEANNGSTLDGAHVINFITSGGPKVAGINIGTDKVAADARVIVTFDQALATNIDITKHVSLAGGGAIVSRQGNNQIVFALQNLARCTPFSVNIAKGLTGENGLESKTTWSYASRVNCRSTQVIGYSVKGRPIVAYYYGSGNTTILFNGGIHGSEPSGTYILQDFVARLDSEAHKIPAGKQVVVVPNTNPDAIAANSRFNANGVNIDRNFPESDWQRDIVTAGGAKPGGGGSAPLSEPETRALANLTTSLRPRMTISYHSQGSALGHNETGDAATVASLYARNVGYRMFGNAESELGYEFTGEYEGWIAEKLGLPAILIELPNHTGRFFSKHESTMWKMINL